MIAKAMIERVSVKNLTVRQP